MINSINTLIIVVLSILGIFIVCGLFIIFILCIHMLYEILYDRCFYKCYYKKIQGKIKKKIYTNDTNLIFMQNKYYIVNDLILFNNINLDQYYIIKYYSKYNKSKYVKNIKTINYKTFLNPYFYTDINIIIESYI